MPLLVLSLWLPTANAAARTISWSGYNWDVRPAGTAQGPGANDWSDSTANVQVQGSDLLLSTAQDSSGNWTSSEVDNQQHLGYGTYRWVVATDLSSLDANEVLGMFTYGGSDSSNNEIDIEASHWGDMSNPTGSATVWQNANAGLSEERDFSYSSRPPYVNQFTWSPARIDYLVTDATGATLLAWTVTTGVPTPSTEVPRINYWRNNNVAPASVRTIRISSFTWAPLGQSLPPVTSPPPSTGPPPAGPGGPATSSPQPPPMPIGALPRTGGGERLTCVIGAPRVANRGGHSKRPVDLMASMPASRFPVAWLRRDGVLDWSATGVARAMLIIRRWLPGTGFMRWSVLHRSVGLGSDRIRMPHAFAGRRIGRGTYDIWLTSGVRPVRCTPERFVFTVT